MAQEMDHRAELLRKWAGDPSLMAQAGLSLSADGGLESLETGQRLGTKVNQLVQAYNVKKAARQNHPQQAATSVKHQGAPPACPAPSCLRG